VFLVLLELMNWEGLHRMQVFSLSLSLSVPGGQMKEKCWNRKKKSTGYHNKTKRKSGFNGERGNLIM